MKEGKIYSIDLTIRNDVQQLDEKIKLSFMIYRSPTYQHGMKHKVWQTSGALYVDGEKVTEANVRKHSTDALDFKKALFLVANKLVRRFYYKHHRKQIWEEVKPLIERLT
tara:strand:- start:195 stop:524 length:330 start_codon:yes stop_codon:yes gene_type:complete